jgi:LytS/YehU family sensor histidine kinase
MDKVPLSKEIELLHHYTDLEKLRYGEKLIIHQDMTVHRDTIQLAPLILLPFAENCFKHGGVGEDGWFRITMSLHTDDQQLLFHITNSKKKKKETASANGGVGLENIRQRLTLLYPNRHHLDIRDEESSFSVRLEIRFRDEDV